MGESYDFRTPRLYVEAPLGAGARIGTDRAQGNYLLNVLRLKDGDGVLLFNGRDGEWLARIEASGRKGCALVAVNQTRPQPAPADLWYLFAPLKHARLDYMVQKAVEMGAGMLQPVITRHTQVSHVKLERMAANAIEAAEQCGILSVPVVRESVKLERLIGQWAADRRLVFCDEAAEDSDALPLLAPLGGQKLALLVGPEGGFSQDERAMLRALPGVVTIGLGPRILRADTAAVAALAVLQAAAGDWRGRSVRGS